jgi:hypothetical protein
MRTPAAPAPFRQPARDGAARARDGTTPGIQTRRGGALGQRDKASKGAFVSPAASPDVTVEADERRALSSAYAYLSSYTGRRNDRSALRQAAPRGSRYRATLERNQAISAPAQWEIRQSSGNTATPSRASVSVANQSHRTGPARGKTEAARRDQANGASAAAASVLTPTSLRVRMR